MKHKIVIALKMLRYRADAEDRSFLCVVMRQLTSSVLSHHKDTEELIVALLDNQVTMQEMIVEACNMMSIYAEKLDMDSTENFARFLEFRGDYTDSCFTDDLMGVDVQGCVQTRWDVLAKDVAQTTGEMVARDFLGEYYMLNSVSVCKTNWKYLYNHPTTYNFLAQLVAVHVLYDRCDNWDARYELAWILADIMRQLEY